MTKMNFNTIILKAVILIVLVSSFFIEPEWLGRSFLLISAASFGALFLNKDALHEIKSKSLWENLLNILVVLLIGMGVAFILLADSSVKTKASVGCLLLIFLIWSFVKHKKHN